MKYKVIFDNGKPYEQDASDCSTSVDLEDYVSDKELKKALRDFYVRNRNSDFPFDCKVYDAVTGMDLTETQFIQEMISEILNEECGDD